VQKDSLFRYVIEPLYILGIELTHLIYLMLVSDEQTLQSYAEMGRCVSFVKKQVPLRPTMPPHPRLGGAPRPPPRRIPPPPRK
jgi:hypothetical protein